MSTSTPPEGRITSEVRGHLLVMGFDRAHKRNAFGPEMLRGLAEAYARLEKDADLRCGVVFAHGDHFTGGLDLAVVGPAIARGEKLTPDGSVDPWGVAGPQVSKPVVVAVRGLCLTLGIELILSADVCVAASDARFGQIEIKRGIFPFAGATIRLPQRTGWGNAMRYLLTGDEFDAAAALAIGLVQEVVEPGQELERAVAIAERIAKQAPLAVQATLRNARVAMASGQAAAIDDLRPNLDRLLASDDAREGMMSFIERREGRFTGR
jgi:enoyl-CoA hydratase